MTTNQFKIVPHKVLNDTVNVLSIHGSIPLFAEQFSVSYSLQKVTEVSGEGVPSPMGAGNNINGNIVVLRASLSDLTEEAVVAEVAAQLGIELA